MLRRGGSVHPGEKWYRCQPSSLRPEGSQKRELRGRLKSKNRLWENLSVTAGSCSLMQEAELCFKRGMSFERKSALAMAWRLRATPLQKQERSLYGNKLRIHLQAAFLTTQEGLPHHFRRTIPLSGKQQAVAEACGGGEVSLESHCHDNAPENRGAGDRGNSTSMDTNGYKRKYCGFPTPV